MPGGAAAKGWTKIMSAGASAFSALADLWNYFFGSENTMTTTVVKPGRTNQLPAEKKVNSLNTYQIIKYMTYPSKSGSFRIDTIKATQKGAENYRDSLKSITKPYWNGPTIKVDSVKMRVIK